MLCACNICLLGNKYFCSNYLTRSFLPVLIMLPFMLLSFLSFCTVVPLRLAMRSRLSPSRTVTFFVVSFFLLLLLLLLFELLLLFVLLLLFELCVVLELLLLLVDEERVSVTSLLRLQRRRAATLRLSSLLSTSTV